MPKQIPIKIEKVNDPFGEINLADGAVITFRTTVIQVVRQFEDDGKPSVRDDGTAIYGIQSNIQIATFKEPVSKKEMS